MPILYIGIRRIEDKMENIDLLIISNVVITINLIILYILYYLVNKKIERE